MTCNMLGATLDDKYPYTRQYGANYALWVLFGVNLLNFADRSVPSAVKELIIDDLGISDFESSLPTLAMGLVFIVFAVIFGTLADKELVDRRVIIFVGVFFWSLCNGSAGFSVDLTSLIITRGAVGIGEAAYNTVGPPIITDFYPEAERNVAFGIFYMAVPIGAAIGFAIGAIIGEAISWRAAFFAVGIPGLIVAFLLLRMTNPVRGINDDEEEKKEAEMMKKLDWKGQTKVAYEEAKEILSNWHFTLAMLGNCANTFALGGMSEWIVYYFNRYYDVSVGEAGAVLGIVTIISGIGGMVLGAKLADYYQDKVKSAYFLIPALFCFPGAICVLIIVNVTGRENFPLAIAMLFISQLCIWTNLAPISALSISVIPPRLRSRSCGIYQFLQHALGDLISPPIIGAISDVMGLKAGLQCTWIALFVSGGWWLLGYYALPPIQFSNKEEGDHADIGFKHLLCGGYDPLIIQDGEISHKNPLYAIPSKSSKKVNPIDDYDKVENDEDGKKGEVELPQLAYPKDV